MFRRSGSFGGFGSLDPFGTSRGGLGRYNLGQDIASVEAYEAYAIAVAWQNGTATDAEYLASLQRQIDLAPAGTRDKVTAQDKYDDAVYTIERNKLVRTANNSDTEAERIEALRALIAHDRSRLGAMKEDNEQRRELEDRIVNTQSDIRQVQYGQLVEKYNRGQATTAQLLAFARDAYQDTAGTAEQMEWRRTMGELSDRSQQEKLNGLQQDYQHGRDPGGRKLNQQLEAMMSGLVPDSPEWQELNRSREDLSEREKQTARSLKASQAYTKHQQGKISDAQYLEALRQDIQGERPGTQGFYEAKARLENAAWSLAEDKLRFKVERGTAKPSELAAFYRNAQRGMNRGSERWRTLQLAIDRLTGGSGGGSGGGSSGSTSKDGLAWLKNSKLIPLEGSIADATAKGRDVNGKKLPEGALAKLLHVNPLDVPSRSWFEVNRRSMMDAYRMGSSTWVFLDPKGRRYELEFSPDMLSQLDSQKIAMERWAIRNAETDSERSAAMGRYLSAIQDQRDHIGAMRTDELQAHLQVLEDARKRALRAGDIPTYLNIIGQMQDTVRGALGLPTEGDAANPDSPYYVPTSTAGIAAAQGYDPASGTMYGYSQTDLDRIGKVIDSIQPWDPASGASTGDKLLTLLNPPDGGRPAISLVTGEDGAFTRMVPDESRVFFTQRPDGGIEIVSDLDPGAQSLFEQVPLGPNGEMVPRYMQAGQRAKVMLYTTNSVDPGGQAIPVWQQVGVTAADVRFPTGPTPGPTVWPRGAGGRGPVGVGANSASTNPAAGQRTGQQLDVSTITTYEEHGGRQVPVAWYSLNPGQAGAIWVRVPRNTTYGPQLVINGTLPDGTPIRQIGRNSKGQLVANPGGNEVILDPTQATTYFHWYGVGGGEGGGNAGRGVGFPGGDLEVRFADSAGQLHADVQKVRAMTPEREQVGGVVEEEGTGDRYRRRFVRRYATEEEQAAHDERFRPATSSSAQRNLDRLGEPPPSRNDVVSTPRRALPPGYPTAGPNRVSPSRSLFDASDIGRRSTIGLFDTSDIGRRTGADYFKASRTELRQVAKTPPAPVPTAIGGKRAPLAVRPPAPAPRLKPLPARNIDRRDEEGKRPAPRRPKPKPVVKTPVVRASPLAVQRNQPERL